jgi:hypothetical protein
MGLVHLQLGPHPSEGAAELVRGIPHEPTLAFGRLLEPPQHGVHRAREPGDLLGRRRLGYPAVQTGAGDRVDPGADVLHGTQRPPDRPPDDAGEHDRGQRHRHEQGGGERGRAVRHVVQGARDQHRRAPDVAAQEAPLSVVAGQVHRGDPAAVAVAGHAGESPLEVFRRRQHRAVGADHLDHDILGRQVAGPHRLPPPQLRDHRIGLAVHAVVDGVHEHGALGDDQTHARRRQHTQHRDGGERGDPGAQRARQEPSRQAPAGAHGRRKR